MFLHIDSAKVDGKLCTVRVYASLRYSGSDIVRKLKLNSICFQKKNFFYWMVSPNLKTGLTEVVHVKK